MDLFEQLRRRPRPLSKWQFKLWHLFLLVTAVCAMSAYLGLKRRATYHPPIAPSVNVSRLILSGRMWHVYSCHPSPSVEIWFRYSVMDELLVEVGTTKFVYRDDRGTKGPPMGFRPI